MELKNTRTIYSSENREIVLGEFEGKRFVKKTGIFSRSAVMKIMEINSPYIPKIVEIGDDYIVTEYADGEDLASAKIPAKKVYDVALEMCSALESLHNENVIHRDIKPSNIILCDNRHIKLIDFDAARVKKTVTDKDTRFIGTDGFAPPEQYGFTQTDERSDIYALGVTIRLLLGESFNRARYRRVIEKCMRFNPEQRYSSVKALKFALLRHKPLPTACAVGAGTVLVGALIAGLTVMYTANTPKAVENFNVEESVPTTESTAVSSSALESTAVSSSALESTAASGSALESTAVSSSTVKSTAVSSSTVESTAVSSSTLESTAVSSSAVKSTTESTSVPNSYSAAESIPNNNIVPNSSSSTKSSTQSSSVSYSVPITESVPQSSAVSVSSTSTEKTPESVPEPPFPYENERSYMIDWDLLMLPEGFPRLRDKVSYYDFNIKESDDYDHTDMVAINWNVMPYSEVVEIIQKVGDWLGDDCDYRYFLYDTPDIKEVFIGNDKVNVRIVWGHDGQTKTWLFITPKSEKYYFSEPNTDLADPTVTKNSNRMLKWEETILNGNIPKLTDNISNVSRSDGCYDIYWDYMDIEESEAVIQKIIKSFDGEYEFSIRFYEMWYEWSFSGDINGTHRDIEVGYVPVYSPDYDNGHQIYITFK